jgi:hypothetical protein
MHDDDQLLDLVDMQEKKLWKRKSPATYEEIESVEQRLGLRLPDGYRKLFLYSNGGEFAGSRARVSLFSLKDLTEFNPDPVWSHRIPGMIIIGDDAGDFIFYCDPQDHLKRGAWAVFVVGKGAVSFAYSRYVAADAVHLCRRVINGDAILREPYLNIVEK